MFNSVSSAEIGLCLLALSLCVSAIPNPSTTTFFGSNSGIGIIEDAVGKTSGFLVYTSDNNYAISCPHLAHLGWDSISVNDQQAFVVTKDKKTITTPLNTLGFKNLATLDYIKSEFLLNLAGLVIDYPNSLPGSYKVLHSAEGKFLGTILSSGNLGSPGTALGAAGGINGVYGADSAYVAGSPHGSSSYSYGSSNGLSTGTPAYSYGAGNNKLINGKDSEYLEKDGYLVRHCNDQVSNYYNTLGTLNATRTGDVYFFDYCGHALDIYSDTVSVSKRNVGSAVYRGANYFSVFAPLLSSSINRVFLIDRSVFIVHNDGTVFVKPIQFLEPSEVEVVVAARNYVQKLQQFKAEAVLVSKGLRKGTLDITTLLKNKPSLLIGEEFIKSKTSSLEPVTNVIGDQTIGSLPVFDRALSQETLSGRPANSSTSNNWSGSSFSS